MVQQIAADGSIVDVTDGGGGDVGGDCPAEMAPPPDKSYHEINSTPMQNIDGVKVSLGASDAYCADPYVVDPSSIIITVPDKSGSENPVASVTVITNTPDQCINNNAI